METLRSGYRLDGDRTARKAREKLGRPPAGVLFLFAFELVFMCISCHVHTFRILRGEWRTVWLWNYFPILC